MSPFRYPPLAYGSRFGDRLEPSLFYGGTTVDVTLCESAYYRFCFYYDMEKPPVNGMLQTQHTLFDYTYATDVGVKLQEAPFDIYSEALRDPVNYRATQALGSEMRQAGVSAFEYCSARDHSGGINIALYGATPLTCTKPLNEIPCLCQTDKDEVVFSIKREITTFSLDQFLVNGVINVGSQVHEALTGPPQRNRSGEGVPVFDEESKQDD